MTETEWLSATDAQEMFVHLGERLPHRKVRLLAGALCRRDPERMADPLLVRAVELCEAFADDPAAARADMRAAFRRVRRVGRNPGSGAPEPPGALGAPDPG